MAIALFAIHPIALLSSFLSIHLLETAWRLSSVSDCLILATLLLVALGLDHLMASIDSENHALQERRELLAQPASVPATALESVVRDSLRVMLSSFALAIAFAMGAQRKGQGVPLLVEWYTAIRLRGRALPGLSTGATEEEYFSRLVPEDDDSSETGVPPPPEACRPVLRRHHPGRKRPASESSAKSADPLQNCRSCLKALWR